MKSVLLSFALTFLFAACSTAQEQDTLVYTFKKGDPYGTGKWFMGREIAHVMGFHGVDWLERPERDEEEKTAKLIRNLELTKEDTLADIGAGSGYHTFKIAPKAGFVYAVDIQEEMLNIIEEGKKEKGLQNISIVKGSESDVNLPPSSINKVLLVDVYHEFSYPKEMMESIAKALKTSGLVYLVEFRAEDDWVPIKRVHKMTSDQAIKEMEAMGFEFLRNIGNLPWQHCMVFRKS